MAVELESRVARLEEAVSSLKSGQVMMQWAGGLAMALLIAFSAALLNRTFAVADQLVGLSNQTGAVVASIQAVQTDVADVKTDLRDVRSDLAGLKTEVGDIRSNLAALAVSVERIATTLSRAANRPEPGAETPPQH
jgi:septal ring factor EnvC (AmiA/AmiB activator)